MRATKLGIMICMCAYRASIMPEMLHVTSVEKGIWTTPRSLGSRA